MFLVVIGGGKVGANLTRTLLGLGHEVVVIEQSRPRFDGLEAEFRHRAIYGDATELHVLEAAGMRRPPEIVVAVTGDDEDNIVTCQLARELYGVPKVIARVNDPRNQPHFDLLGITPTISATSTIMALIEHEVPQHGFVHLLHLRAEDLEIVEIEVAPGAPAAGKHVGDLNLPDTARFVSVVSGGRAEIATGATLLQPGDQVLAILKPGSEDVLRDLLLAPPR